VVQWLIDNAEVYDGLIVAIRSARESVWVTQLAFDSDCVAHAHESVAPETEIDVATASATSGDIILAETLLGLAEYSSVDIRILLNATILLDTTTLLRRFFEMSMTQRPYAGRIRVRGFRRFPQLLHVKMVVVDEREAFILGSPFANGYWDVPRHPPRDLRRVERELCGRPVHDVSLRVTDAPARQLASIFLDLWAASPARDWEGPPRAVRRLEARSSSRSSPPVPPPHPSPPAESLGIVQTLPRRTIGRFPDGATAILDALLAGIESARSLIYIEHQYLSARPVVAALAHALARSAELEIIVVLNQNADVTAYRRWQNLRLAEHGLHTHPRVGLFSLWSAAATRMRPAVTDVNQIFVHSKVVVVDDAWATVGTANLDGVSLHSYGDDFRLAMARRIFRDVRNIDVNVTVAENTSSGRGTGSVADLRTRLWSEHLGIPARELVSRPAAGWLPTWRTSAARFVARLNARDVPDGSPNEAANGAGHVVAYSARSTPAEQLADAGVRLDAPGLALCFDPGWLEVHVSPNWVRNMFL
jgi:phosphatidylserine/phosphatidylglycerophosphate/cardiolipin synthase-like enzyme